MLIPYTQLSPETLDELMSDYATRDGTDDGQYTTLAERKAYLLAQLQSEQAFITYNYEHQQACLVARHEVAPESLREYMSIKQALQEEAAEAKAESALEAEFTNLYSSMAQSGAFPIDLGHTCMTSGVNALLESGKVTRSQLQDVFRRHSMGDYGVVSWGDKLQNLKAIKSKDYMLSRYEVGGISIYVEMLAGWPRTMLMQPSER